MNYIITVHYIQIRKHIPPNNPSILHYMEYSAFHEDLFFHGESTAFSTFPGGAAQARSRTFGGASSWNVPPDRRPGLAIEGFWTGFWPSVVVETRWSPRTRMLTRMLMVQMSKHMVMQWRTIPFCNSLFEQSCTCFPCYQSAVWSGKCRVWSVK